MNNPDTYQALVWGYNIIWIMIAVYLLILRRKINNLDLPTNQEEKKESED